MYSTCLFCSSPLGTNEVIEHFPVGRRLAFDGEKGRLWVVCRSCERWNLTPLEERWEAIEQCERLYRETRRRVSTEHIGLARLAEGLELVRIGAPQRPEMAAWRYGDQFGRRRRVRMLATGAIIAAGGAVVVGGVVAGAGVGFVYPFGNAVWKYATRGSPSRVVATIRDANGVPYRIRRSDLLHSRLLLGSDGDLALDVYHDQGPRITARRLHLEGTAARRAASALFPAVNLKGGTTEEVQQAVGRLERAGSAEQFLRDEARRGAKVTGVSTAAETRRRAAKNDVEWSSGLLALSTPGALALEMALHEEQERRALEGELAELEAAWRDAEEIGAIADGLLLPTSVEAALARLKRKLR